GGDLPPLPLRGGYRTLAEGLSEDGVGVRQAPTRGWGPSATHRAHSSLTLPSRGREARTESSARPTKAPLVRAQRSEASNREGDWHWHLSRRGFELSKNAVLLQ